MLPRPAPDQVEREAREDRAPPAPPRPRASAAEWPRPRKRSAASSSDCTPSDSRSTPAARKPRKRPASAVDGLASSVTSRSAASGQRAAIALEDRGGGGGRHQRRRAAAEEDAGDRPPGRFRGEAVELGEVGAAPALLVDAVADVAVEVAVGALRAAERPVDVDGERLGRASPGMPTSAKAGSAPSSPAQAGAKQAATSWRKASARWLMRCFSAGSISPKVMSRPSGDEDRIVAEAAGRRAAGRPARPSTRPSNVSQWPSGQASDSAQTKRALRSAPCRASSRFDPAPWRWRSPWLGPAQRAE